MNKLKKLLFSLILISGLVLITGCGETEEDYKNAENPHKFVERTLEKAYGEEIIIERKTKLEDNHYLFDVHFVSDESLTFQAETFWETSAGIPTRHYVISHNYQENYYKKFFTEYFQNNYNVRITYEETKDYDSEMTNPYVILEVSDYNYLSTILNEFVTLQQHKKVKYGWARIGVKYDDKIAYFQIDDYYSLEDYQNILERTFQ